MARIDELKREMLAEIAESLVNRELVRATVECVRDDSARHVMTLRYLNGYTWPQIAEAMEKDERYLHKLHRKGLDQLEASFPGKWDAEPVPVA